MLFLAVNSRPESFRTAPTEICRLKTESVERLSIFTPFMVAHAPYAPPSPACGERTWMREDAFSLNDYSREPGGLSAGRREGGREEEIGKRPEGGRGLIHLCDRCEKLQGVASPSSPLRLTAGQIPGFSIIV